MFLESMLFFFFPRGLTYVFSEHDKHHESQDFKYNKTAHSGRMKSGTILFLSSFASIQDGIRAHFTTIIYEIITSLEEAKLIMFPGFPSQTLIRCVIIWFNCVFLSLSNTNLLHPLPSHENTVVECGEEALRQPVMSNYENV